MQAWFTGAALLAMLAARPAPYVRTVVLLALVACPVVALVPNGLGSNFERLAWMSPQMMRAQSPGFAAAVLALAGVYQLSPVQDLCLAHCRAPAAFLAAHYRPGAAGALRLGVIHGAWCLGCCGLLMGLLLVGGVMNLVWIAALTVLVAAEKLLPGGRWIARAAGGAFLGLAALILWRG